MRLLATVVAVLAIILGVIYGLIPLVLLGCAALLLIDPLRPPGERTWDALARWDRYQAAARARHERTHRDPG